MKKRLLKWLLGILIAFVVIVTIDMMICIHQYGKGKVNPWQVAEVNLFREVVVLEEQNQEALFLTDHDWTGDELLKLGCRETDRMGSMGYYTAPDGTEFRVNDRSEWCFFFRLHDIEGITLDTIMHVFTDMRHDCA